MGRILWFIIVALIVFWLLGLVFEIGGGLIHIILVVAGIIFILPTYNRQKICITKGMLTSLLVKLSIPFYYPVTHTLVFLFNFRIDACVS